jgi:hypothetical protein
VAAWRPNRQQQTVLSCLLPALEPELDSLPAAATRYAILDKLTIHHAAEVMAWAAAPERCARPALCSTPTPGAWLNLVESVFRSLDRRVSTGTDYRTLPHLDAALDGGRTAWNAHPTPFTWRAKRWPRRRRRAHQHPPMAQLHVP